MTVPAFIRIFIKYLIIVLIHVLLLISWPISIFGCIHLVKEYEAFIVLRWGLLKKGFPVKGGFYFTLPVIETYFLIDCRLIVLDVDPQEALTKDGVTIKVENVIYYYVEDPLKAILYVEDYHNSTCLLAMSVLRSVICCRTLLEILEQRELIKHLLMANLEEATSSWGVKIERVEIKDVQLPIEMQRVMAAEAQAVQITHAKLIEAEGELKSAKALGEAATIMSKNPAAFQLKYLQAINSIAIEKHNTFFVFPMSMDLIQNMF